MKYSSRIRTNNRVARSRKTSSTRSSGKVKTYSSQNWLKRSKASAKAKKKNFLKSKRVKKIIYIILLFFVVAFFVGLIGILTYVQSLTEDLPSPDKPFGPKNSASEIYDRNGKLLYRVFADQNADPVKMDDVPELLKWSFLAAEDIDFYSHPGVDIPGVIRCGLRYFRSGNATCGASTITQQLIKQTALTNERKIERKVKEVILALQIEQDRDKEEILEMYLTIAPEGSNVYGVTSAAKFYFDKEPKELNLAEMAIIAAIPQDPSRMSPTKSSNPEESQKRVKGRQEYVLDQMEKNMKKINEEIKKSTGEENALTKEMIQEAREFELAYKDPIFEINAAHFVFFAQKLLQDRPYNNGEPFTLGELETQGLRIYTTLDSDYQQIAEEEVRRGVDVYGKQYGASNASLVSTNPKTGEILAMVGSYDYFGKESPEGCSVGLDCRFEPKVNISDTLQSYGSSMKSMVYYKAIMDKVIYPGSILADVPISIGNYTPKNYEGGFIGINSARHHLVESRNIPAIVLVQSVGVQNFIAEMEKWGYTTFNNPQGYGPAVSIGGADIKLIEHAQAYGVLANQGKLIQYEAIMKIEDKNGELIYEHEPEPQQVADPRGVYLVNHMLNGRNRGPGVSWDGRDVAGKTGTSEGQRETLFATYTPEIVAVGWLGNNNNEGMRYGASGLTSAKPWVSEYLKRIGDSIPKTEFARPEGIEFSNANCMINDKFGCEGTNGDLAITGFKVPAYLQLQEVEVCTDQQDRLAREIDIKTGNTMKINGTRYTMPAKDLQPFLDKFLSGNENIFSIPTEYCTISRNPSGSADPWAVISSPENGAIVSQSLSITYEAFSPDSTIDKVEFYLDNSFLGRTTTASGNVVYDIKSQSAGTRELRLRVFDKAGKEGTSSISIEIIGDLTITSPANNSSVKKGDTIDVTFTYTGGNLNQPALIVGDKVATQCSQSKCVWKVENDPGVVTIYVRGRKSGQTIESKPINITITPGGIVPNL
jgi:penicillin-binding protein 1A